MIFAPISFSNRHTISDLSDLFKQVTFFISVLKVYVDTALNMHSSKFPFVQHGSKCFFEGLLGILPCLIGQGSIQKT